MMMYGIPALKRVEMKGCDDVCKMASMGSNVTSSAGWVSHFTSNFPLFASNLLIQVEASTASEMPKKEKACKEFGRDLSDSNTAIYFSSSAFLGPVFADEIYKQTAGWTHWRESEPRIVCKETLLSFTPSFTMFGYIFFVSP